MPPKAIRPTNIEQLQANAEKVVIMLKACLANLRCADHMSEEDFLNGLTQTLDTFDIPEGIQDHCFKLFFDGPEDLRIRVLSIKNYLSNLIF